MVARSDVVYLCVCVCVLTENTEAELLHTYSKVDPLDTLILCVRLAVLMAVTLTVPVVLFPVRPSSSKHPNHVSHVLKDQHIF